MNIAFTRNVLGSHLFLNAGQAATVGVAGAGVASASAIGDSAVTPQVTAKLIGRQTSRRVAHPVSGYVMPGREGLSTSPEVGAMQDVTIPTTRDRLNGVVYEHRYVAPTDEQVYAWSRKVFDYRDAEGRPYSAATIAKSQLMKRVLRVKSQQELDGIVRFTLIQMAQFTRDNKKNIPGLTLPVSSRVSGILVMPMETTNSLSALFIDPNTLSASTKGATGQGMTPYALRFQLIAAVSEILVAGQALMNTLDRAEFGGDMSRKSMRAETLIEAIHAFRSTVSKHQQASADKRYDYESPVPDARAAKIEVIAYAHLLLNRDVPESYHIDRSSRPLIVLGINTRQEAFRSAKSAEHYESLYEAAVAKEKERVAALQREAEDAQRAEAMEREVRNPKRQSLSDETMRKVHRAAMEYYGDKKPKRVFVNESIEDDAWIAEFHWWVARSSLSSGRVYGLAIRMEDEDHAIPMPLELAAIAYYGSTSPDRIFVDEELVDDFMRARGYWEGALMALAEGKRPAESIHMVDKNDKPTSFPPEIEALYSD